MNLTEQIGIAKERRAFTITNVSDAKVTLVPQVLKTAQRSQPAPLEAVQGGSEGPRAAGAALFWLLSLLSPLIKAVLDKSYGPPVPAIPASS